MLLFFRCLILICPFIFFTAATLFDLNPSGVKVIEYQVANDNPMISRLFPADRLEGATINGQNVLKEPIYFTVRYPQNYSQAAVTIDYSEEGQDKIQLGLQYYGEDEWNYYIQPLQNKTLDELAWSKLEAGDLTLWQRRAKFSSINDFLENYYGLNVGAYNFDLLKKYTEPSYLPKTDYFELNRAIRGEYSIYTYVKNEPLDWEFRIVDFNRSVGPDEIKVNITDWKDRTIYSKSVPDDGFTSTDSGASAERTVKINIPDLAEGVYKINWASSNDILTTAIKTKQRLIAFIDKIYLVNNKSYWDGLPNLNISSTTLYSNISSFSFFTAHPEGMQTIKINNKEAVKIDATHKQFYYKADSGLSKIEIPLNDVIITGDGLIFLNKESYFNPEVIKLKGFSNDLNVDYIIAKYKSPTKNENDKNNTVTFDLANAAVTNNSIRFIISAPQYNDQGNVLSIKKIQVNLQKPPLKKIDEILNKLFYEFKKVF